MKKVFLFALVSVQFNLAFAADAVTVPPVVKEKPLTTISVNDEGEHLLADSKGNTLYVFDLDQGKLTSVCNTNCAEVWPPYIVSADEAKNLVAPLGSVIRANKMLQMTYGGRPVYAYAFDRGVNGDAGDNVGNVWHYIEIAVTPPATISEAK